MDYFRADKPLPPVPPEAKRLASAFGAKVSSLASAAGQAASNAKQRAASASTSGTDSDAGQKSAFDFSRARTLFESGGGSDQRRQDAAGSAAVYAAKHMPVRSVIDAAKQVPTDSYVSAVKSSHPNAGRFPLASAIDAAKKVNTDSYVKAYDAAPKDQIAGALATRHGSHNDSAASQPSSANSVKALRSQLETQLNFSASSGGSAAHSTPQRQQDAWGGGGCAAQQQRSPVPAPARLPPPPPVAGAPLPVKSGSYCKLLPFEKSDPHAVASFDFEGQNFDELTCTRGDVVLMKKRIDNDWVYCQNARSAVYGIVPVSFLDIKVPLPVEESMSVTTVPHDSSSGVAGPRGTVLYDFQSDVPGDLTPLGAGTQIALLHRIDADWLRGRHVQSDGSLLEGIIPSTYVEVTSDVPAAGVHTVAALFDYEPGSREDLGFKAGDMIDVFETVDSQWLRGRLVQFPSVSGIFPANFVEQSTTSAPVETQTHADGSSPWLGKTAVALWDYRGDSQDDLWFSAGDRIRVLEEIGADWLRGQLVLDLANARNLPTGMFPRSFVELQ